MSAADPTNEFSRPLVVDPARERAHFRISATADECAALARRFGLAALESLTAEGQIRSRPGGVWQFTARLRASLAQFCVVTLEPAPRELDETFELAFRSAPAGNPHDLDVADEDAEPLPDDGRLDAGEIVAQNLYLALDPFPRAGTASWSDRIEDLPAPSDPPPPDGRASPFAELEARLRVRRSGEA